MTIKKGTLKEMDRKLKGLHRYTTPERLPALIAELEAQMQAAAARLEFEVAAVLRDQVEELKTAIH
mgnify:FL=1